MFSTSRLGGHRSSTGITNGEHKLIGTAIFQKRCEQPRPVCSDGIVACVQECADVGFSYLCTSVVESQCGKTGDKFILDKVKIIDEVPVFLISWSINIIVWWAYFVCSKNIRHVIVDLCVFY